MSRAKQRENRRNKAWEIKQGLRNATGREELLDRRDFCGISDPTPYQAVKNIVNQQKQKRTA